MSDLFAALAPKPAKPRTPHAAVAQADRPAGDHVCAVCGIACGFGFGVFLRRGQPGRWSCLAHRDDVERMTG